MPFVLVLLVVHCSYGGLPLTSAHLHNTCAVRDVAALVAAVARRRPHDPLFAAGFSLGSNTLARYLGEVGDDATPLQGALSFGNPYDLLGQLRAAEARSRLQRWFWGISKRRAVNFLVRTVTRHPHVFASHPAVDIGALSRCRSLREFADRCTRVISGHSSVDEYYAAASCLHVLHAVRVPLICVSARDDPVCVGRVTERQVRAAAAASAYVVAVETHAGGHLA